MLIRDSEGLRRRKENQVGNEHKRDGSHKMNWNTVIFFNEKFRIKTNLKKKWKNWGKANILDI